VKIDALIDTAIRLREETLPPGCAKELKSALSIPNMDKVAARREKLADWEDMPDFINLWRYDGIGRLVIPRGFRENFIRGMDRSGFEINWIDDRAFCVMDPEFFADLQPITLRDHQGPAVKSLIAHENGIYQAPPGSGKTVTILELIRRVKQRSIILVDKSNIAKQWQKRIHTFLGVEAGMIGDGVFDPGEITVALKQTLWSRRRELTEQGFFNEWGIVAYDECHHVTAETYQFIVQKFNAHYLIGVSATPKRVPWTFPIATGLLGPIIHETTHEELRGKGLLVKPKIVVVPTAFDFQFRSTKVNRGGYRVGNNYQQMMKSLISNEDRNNRIAEKLNSMPERYILVVSKRLEHFDRVIEKLNALGYPNPIYRLTGKETLSERVRISEAIEAGPSVTFSTIADEALDIPRLDTIFLIWPTRNASVVRQQVGRVERATDGKEDALVFDWWDVKVGVLKNQFSERMRDVYRAEQMEITYEATAGSY
jgi:superfamily II DNA or RNA helicase